MASLNFYGGINEIGGNKILLNDGDTRVFLDFGKNYAKEKDYFDFPLLQPREEKHLLALDILPNLKGLYKADGEEIGFQAILLTHAHGDHYDYIRFVKDEIPICCSDTAKSIISARDMCGGSGIGADYKIASSTVKKGDQIFKSYDCFQSSTKKCSKPLDFEPINVDHSIPGAFGFIIHTKEGTLVYSGDLRLHGSHPEKTTEFINRARDSKPDALIIEGTNISGSKVSSEKEVKEKVLQIVKETPQLVLASFAIADIDRLKTFYEVAIETNRKIVIPIKLAFILQKLSEDKSLSMFNLNDANVQIYQKDKRTEYCWETKIAGQFPDNIVTSEEVSNSQPKSILVTGFYDMNELIDLKPAPGSIYILSQSEPFNEEMEIDHNKLMNWLARFGLPIYQVHCSGHAAPQELKSIIKEINPKKIYLMHTEYPELYKRYISDLNIETVIPKELETYGI